MKKKYPKRNLTPQEREKIQTNKQKAEARERAVFEAWLLKPVPGHEKQAN